jgi:hypothetical protein
MRVMKNIVLLAALALVGWGVHAQTASRLGELRTLVHPPDAGSRADIKPAQASRPTAGGEAAGKTRQLSPQERAELRRQLSEFRRPAGKGS